MRSPLETLYQSNRADSPLPCIQASTSVDPDDAEFALPHPTDKINLC